MISFHYRGRNLPGYTEQDDGDYRIITTTKHRLAAPVGRLARRDDFGLPIPISLGALQSDPSTPLVLAFDGTSTAAR